MSLLMQYRDPGCIQKKLRSEEKEKEVCEKEETDLRRILYPYAVIEDKVLEGSMFNKIQMEK